MRWVAAIAVATIVAGCGAPQVKRSIAKQGWPQLTSDHFVLVTDLPPKMALLRLRELEQMWHALADNYVLVAPKLAPPTTRLHVVHLNSCSDFRRVIWRDGIAGFVTSTIDFESSRMMVTCEQRQKARKRQASPRTEILLHELAHVFNNHYFARTPIWLNEGLATYYQTLGVIKGKVVLGRLTFLDLHRWRYPKWLPSVRELTGFGYRKFYDKQRAHYYAAWKLIHLLNSNRRYQRLFRAYLARLASGVAHEKAWTSTVATIGAAKLQAEYRRYERRGALRLWTRPYAMKSQLAKPTVRSLRAGEVHALWAHLQMVRADADRDNRDLGPAKTHLRYAAADDPDWNGTLFWRASFAYHFERKRNGLDTAERLLRRYVKRRPDDGRAWLALVKVGFARVVPKGHQVVNAPALPGLDRLADDIASLVRVARTAEQLNVIGWYYALKNRPRTGLNFAVRALRKQPRCAGCMDTLALLLFQRGDAKQAVDVMRRAIGLRAERGVPETWNKRLAHYQRKANEPRSAVAMYNSTDLPKVLSAIQDHSVSSRVTISRFARLPRINDTLRMSLTLRGPLKRLVGFARGLSRLGKVMLIDRLAVSVNTRNADDYQCELQLSVPTVTKLLKRPTAVMVRELKANGAVLAVLHRANEKLAKPTTWIGFERTDDGRFWMTGTSPERKHIAALAKNVGARFHDVQLKNVSVNAKPNSSLIGFKIAGQARRQKN